MKSNKKYEELKEAFSFLMKERGFSLIYEESYEKNYFGDFGNGYAILASDDFKIDLILEQGNQQVGVRSINGPEYSIPIDMVRTFVLGIDSLDSTIDELSKFLKEHFDEVKNMFSKDNVEETMKQLNRIGDKRAQRMFPKLSKEKENKNRE